MDPIPDSLLTLTAYAAHRGVSKMAVSRAIKVGRLVKSVTRDERNQPKINDVALADQEWEASTDPQKRMNATGGVDRAVPVLTASAPSPRPSPPSVFDVAPPAEASPPGEMSLASAAARSKHWEAELRELNFRKAAGELVPTKDVTRRMVDMITASKTHLLAIPSRAMQAMPHLTPADLVKLEELVRESLEELTEVRP